MTYAQACKALARARDERKRYQATMNTRDTEAWTQLRALWDVEITLQHEVRVMAWRGGGGKVLPEGGG